MLRTIGLMLTSLILIALLALSGFNPHDRATWFLEVFPVMIALPVLWATYARFPLTTLLYVLIFVHALVLMLGGTYTYAEVPFGYWLKDILALSRNPFDRMVHFAYGGLLAYPFRELLMRVARVQKTWSYYFSISSILAQSGLFEVIEAVVAVLVSPELGNLYLGTQGDEWDAQKDMAAALAGALLAMSVTFATSRFPNVRTTDISR